MAARKSKKNEGPEFDEMTVLTVILDKKYLTHLAENMMMKHMVGGSNSEDPVEFLCACIVIASNKNDPRRKGKVSTTPEYPHGSIDIIRKERK